MELEAQHLIYKCSKCMYYVHPHCATQRTENFMTILLPGLGKTEKNFNDADHPNLVHLPCNFACHYTDPHRTDCSGIQDYVLIQRSMDRTRRIKMYRRFRQQKRLGLYPSETIRPVTGHWKVVDDVQQ
ncbi:hypothetical protein QVD17_09948 [Tagetes erecta]|uniref:Uncharacterized protein n=1 Tax=Tagetes erecta TaxID=13708 RepID=A0AAD8L1H7_TARER|nr:hypothetical protein QVD17_09948 [Tagetes erecta]